MRANTSQVRAIVDTDPLIPIEPFIEAASRLVDKVDACDTNNTLDSEDLLQIEIWLSAHFYVQRDPTYISKSTLSASASFSKQDYLETAKMLDTSGCLRKILERKVASGTWLGKPPSTQIPYSQRN